MQSQERASVFQQLQIGVETTPGTLVAANKRLLGTSVGAIEPDIPAEAFRPYGSKASTDVLTGKGHGMAPIEGILNPNDLIYLLSSAYCKATITTPGGATDTREWTFLGRNFGPDDFQTYTCDFGSFEGGERAKFAVVNGFGFEVGIGEARTSVTGNLLMGLPDAEDVWPTGHEVWQLSTTGTVSGGTFTLDVDGDTTGNLDWDSTAAEVQAALAALASVGAGNVFVKGTLAGDDMIVVFGGTLFGTNVDDIVVDNTLITGGGTVVATNLQQGATVTDVELVTIPSRSYDIYVATADGDLPADFVSGAHATQLTRAKRVAYSLPERFNPGKYVRSDTDSFDAIIELPIEGSQVTLNIMANDIGREFLSHMKEGQKLYVMVVGTSAMEIEANFPYAVQAKFAMKITDWTPGDDDGSYDAEVVGEVLYDADLSYGEFKARSDMTAL
jgi:hypothetical protein